ncbi:MAG: hypothetical protein JWN10_1165 [Solirubrobacterales bacterium]|nr:hypothetical protein [Solirubrobacterales bacterium]
MSGSRTRSLTIAWAVAACARDLDAELLAERDQHERTWGRRAPLQEQLRTADLRINAKLEEDLAEEADDLATTTINVVNTDMLEAA